MDKQVSILLGGIGGITLLVLGFTSENHPWDYFSVMFGGWLLGQATAKVLEDD